MHKIVKYSRDYIDSIDHGDESQVLVFVDNLLTLAGLDKRDVVDIMVGQEGYDFINNEVTVLITYEPGTNRPNQKHIIQEASDTPEKSMCVIPPKAIRTEGERESKNISTDNGFES